MFFDDVPCLSLLCVCRLVGWLLAFTCVSWFVIVFTVVFIMCHCLSLSFLAVPCFPCVSLLCVGWLVGWLLVGCLVYLLFSVFPCMMLVGWLGVGWLPLFSVFVLVFPCNSLLCVGWLIGWLVGCWFSFCCYSLLFSCF